MNSRCWEIKVNCCESASTRCRSTIRCASMPFNHMMYCTSNELVQGVRGRHGNLPDDEGGEGYRALPLLAHPQQHSGLRCANSPSVKTASYVVCLNFDSCSTVAIISSGSGSSILGWIRIQYGSGSRALMTKNWGKNYSWNKNKIVFGSKTTIFLSLGLHKKRPSYWRSLQLSKEAIKHFKTLNF